MTVQFYSFSDLPEDLKEFWKSRVKAQDPVSCLTGGPEWYEMMQSIMRAEGGNLKPEGGAVIRQGVRGLIQDEAVVVLKSEDRCKALLPLLPGRRSIGINIARRRLCAKEINILSVSGGDLIEHDVLIDELSEMFSNVADKYPAVDALWFNHIGSEDRYHKLAEAARASGRDLLHRVSRDIPHYRLKLPPSHEDCLKLRSKRTWKQLLGLERVMCEKEKAVCRMIEIRQESDWKPYEQRILDLMNSTWQAEELGHGFSVEEMRNISGRGWLRSFLLLLGEKVIAFALCYQGAETLIYEKIGYDRSCSKSSPGSILLYKILEAIYAKDTPVYLDFGEGEADYKKYLSNDVIKVNSCLIVRNKRGLRIWFGIKGICDWINRFGKKIIK